MQTRLLTLQAPQGLHLRIAGAIAQVAQHHHARVTVGCNGCRFADACSVMQLLTLGAPCGAAITVEADGPDEDIVIGKLSELLMNGAGI